MTEAEAQPRSDESIGPVDPSETELVRFARRDPAAFAALYRRYAAPVYRYLYHRVGCAADAEDLTSQVFSEALEGLFRYKDQGSFAAWLFTIARRKAIGYYRRQRADQPLDQAGELPGEADDPLDQVALRENMEKIAGLVSRLGENEQELLRLRFSAGLTYKEMGECLGRSEAAAKMAVHRLLRRLQADWGDEA